MGKPVPNSLRRRCIEVVEAHPQGVTPAQVLGVVGPYISATSAVRVARQKREAAQRYLAKKKGERRAAGVKGLTRYYEYRSPEQLAELGRRALVNYALNNASRSGHIVRIRNGLFGPAQARGTPGAHAGNGAIATTGSLVPGDAGT